jgi:hypothetical protein
MSTPFPSEQVSFIIHLPENGHLKGVPSLLNKTAVDEYFLATAFCLYL